MFHYLLKEISFDLSNMDVPPYSTEFPLPTLPSIRNKTFKNGTESRVKEAENVSSSVSPGPEALHQQMNVVEIAVVLVIGATTAIGSELFHYNFLFVPLFHFS